MVESGALASDIQILSGGQQTVFGTEVSAILSNGATQYDYGSASNETVQSGGIQVVEAGASASGVTINGAQYLYGSAKDDTVQSGGLVVVENGGSVDGLHVNNGVVYVVSGAQVSGATMSGGTLELASGAAKTAVVTFTTSAGGILQLDGSQTFSGTISGFGEPEYLDLADIAFNSTTTTVGFSAAGNNLSGTLTVSDGIHTANLTLLGQYTTAQFTKQSDGHGGTLIGDPPVNSVIASVLSPDVAQHHTDVTSNSSPPLSVCPKSS